MGDGREELADPDLRRELLRFVERRVPEAEAEDLVQTILTDAVASAAVPEHPEELRRWLYGVAKNKVADAHRRRGRDPVPISSPGDEVAAESAPHDAEDLLRWAERELPDTDAAPGTLDWMLRESAGERLEEIARDERVPATRVRQRVARLRRFLRERWAVQAALVGGFAVALGVVYWRAGSEPPPQVVLDTPDHTVERGRALRLEALAHCREERWQRCIDGLDEARAVDPVGDEAEEVRDAREAAGRALAPAPPPVTSTPTQAPPEPLPRNTPEAVPKRDPAPKYEAPPREKGPRPPPDVPKKPPPGELQRKELPPQEQK